MIHSVKTSTRDLRAAEEHFKGLPLFVLQWLTEVRQVNSCCCPTQTALTSTFGPNSKGVNRNTSLKISRETPTWASNPDEWYFCPKTLLLPVRNTNFPLRQRTWAACARSWRRASRPHQTNFQTRFKSSFPVQSHGIDSETNERCGESRSHRVPSCLNPSRSRNGVGLSGGYLTPVVAVRPALHTAAAAAAASGFLLFATTGWNALFFYLGATGHLLTETRRTNLASIYQACGVKKVKLSLITFKLYLVKHDVILWHVLYILN